MVGDEVKVLRACLVFCVTQYLIITNKIFAFKPFTGKDKAVDADEVYQRARHLFLRALKSELLFS